MLDHICKRWDGPIVVAVYAPEGAAIDEAAVCAPGQVDYRVFAVSEVLYTDHNLYPVNALRNLAVERVATSHFLLCDIDLWPDATLRPRLRSLAASPKYNATFHDPTHALVVAAFAREVKTDCASSTAKAKQNLEVCHREAAAMPATFDELKTCIIEKDCHIFDRYNQDGHGTTDYRSWLRTEGKSARPVKCFLSNRYEPYVVLRKSPLLPKYEETFTGYGKNKIQNVVHLRYAGWSFSVLSRSFLSHFPHHKSAARVKWEGDAVSVTDHRHKMDTLYRAFLDALLDVYGAPGSHADHTKICNT